MQLRNEGARWLHCLFIVFAARVLVGGLSSFSPYLRSPSQRHRTFLIYESRTRTSPSSYPFHQRKVSKQDPSTWFYHLLLVSHPYKRPRACAWGEHLPTDEYLPFMNRTINGTQVPVCPKVCVTQNLLNFIIFKDMIWAHPNQILDRSHHYVETSSFIISLLPAAPPLSSNIPISSCVVGNNFSPFIFYPSPRSCPSIACFHRDYCTGWRRRRTVGEPVSFVIVLSQEHARNRARFSPFRIFL